MPHWQLLQHTWLACSLNTAMQGKAVGPQLGIPMTTDRSLSLCEIFEAVHYCQLSFVLFCVEMCDNYCRNFSCRMCDSILLKQLNNEFHILCDRLASRHGEKLQLVHQTCKRFNIFSVYGEVS
jgi:hypothetical protein